MQPRCPAASIIVPTFREEPNIKELVERSFTAMREAGIDAELIVVDDNSRDGTEELIESLSERYPVRLITRRDQRGLASAVLAGFAEARFDRFVVLDADLQHPPEMIPELLGRLERDDCDFAAGTRYARGAGIDGAWPLPRRIASRVATWLARPLAPLSDPMSGFFAIRRDTWQRAARLDPVGYKIGLELYVKGGCRKPAEVPIRFAVRSAGSSKLGLAAQLQYLLHLAKLYRFRYPTLAWVAAAVVLGAILLILGSLEVVLSAE